jgi:ribosome maturation factor RimP
MTMKNIVDAVTDILTPIIDENNFELVDTEFIKEGSNWILRIYIDKEDGVNIDDCQIVSEYLGKKLDNTELIKYSYNLEVSSPGIERIIKKDSDFERFKGKFVKVRLYKKYNDKKEYVGKLMGLIDNMVCIEDGNGIQHKFEKVDVSKVNIHFEF